MTRDGAWARMALPAMTNGSWSAAALSAGQRAAGTPGCRRREGKAVQSSAQRKVSASEARPALGRWRRTGGVATRTGYGRVAKAGRRVRAAPSVRGGRLNRRHTRYEEVTDAE